MTFSLPTILSALLPTIVLEMGMLLFLRERRRKVLLGSVGINVMTNVPLSIWAISTYPTWTGILVAELLVFIIETGAYHLLVRDLRQAAMYSFLCNAVSFLTGLVVEYACIIFDIHIPLLY